MAYKTMLQTSVFVQTWVYLVFNTSEYKTTMLQRWDLRLASFLALLSSVKCFLISGLAAFSACDGYKEHKISNECKEKHIQPIVKSTPMFVHVSIQI